MILISTASPVDVLVQFWINYLHSINIHCKLFKCQCIYIFQKNLLVCISSGLTEVLTFLLTTKVEKMLKGIQS